jgi:hypothetical protein
MQNHPSSRERVDGRTSRAPAISQTSTAAGNVCPSPGGIWRSWAAGALVIGLPIAWWIARGDPALPNSPRHLPEGYPASGAVERDTAGCAAPTRQASPISAARAERTLGTLPSSELEVPSSELPSFERGGAGAGGSNAVAPIVVSRDLQTQWASEPQEAEDLSDHEAAVVAALGIEPAAVLDADCRASVCRVDVIGDSFGSDSDRRVTGSQHAHDEPPSDPMLEVTTVYYPVDALAIAKEEGPG